MPIAVKRSGACVPANRKILLNKIGWQAAVNLYEVGRACDSRFRIAPPRLRIIEGEVDVMFRKFAVKLSVGVLKLDRIRRRHERVFR